MSNELVGTSYAIGESGLVELIGADEAVAQNQFGGSVGVDLVNGTAVQSGEILALTLHLAGGTFQDPAGRLFIFDADPAVDVADTDLTAAVWKTILAVVNVADTDWVFLTAGSVAFKTVSVPFHALPTLYFAFLNTDLTSINSDPGDDEVLELNFRYRRES